MEQAPLSAPTILSHLLEGTPGSAVPVEEQLGNMSWKASLQQENLSGTISLRPQILPVTHQYLFLNVLLAVFVQTS